MKKYIFIICFVLLVLYTIKKICEYKGINMSNNSVYLFFYIFLLFTFLILPQT